MKSFTTHKYVLLLGVILPFLATILAVYLLWERAVHWSDLVLLAVMYSLSILGVTLGFHRMVTHRSFRAHPAVKCILLICGCMALEGHPLEWAATHIKHHAHADREGDPHSPVEGLFHSHLGWIFRSDAEDPNVYCRHLVNDPIVVFVSRTVVLWGVLGFVIPFALGGWTGLLWGGFVRLFFVHHMTWSVNSICHTFGKREFETNDRSRNEWAIGLLAFGEGWHNNHHAFPRSAFHGLRWWQFDLSGYLIRLFEVLGLASDVYRIPPSLQLQRAATWKNRGVSTNASVAEEALVEKSAIVDYEMARMNLAVPEEEMV